MSGQVIEGKTAQTNASLCPFMHGTVYAAPYPGYVHGQNPKICPNGCLPKISPVIDETKYERLLREAYEYCCIYHSENNLGDQARDDRWKVIQDEIFKTETYDLTYDELQYGAKLSWRNAPKCANRAHWQELIVKDYRNVQTNNECNEALLEFLDESISSGATKTLMAVFPHRKPHQKQGPRAWNSNLYRFAGYRTKDGILGDPRDVEFTQLLIERHGWVPPSTRSKWDPLPLLIQFDETQPPQLFPLPSQYVPIIHLEHPDHLGFNVLGLRWFAIAVVAGRELSIGGLVFTMAPFVGYFMDMDVVRDLTDPSRYDVCLEVAEAVKIDTSSANPIWKDEAFMVVNQSVVSSFANSGFACISHHVMAAEFYKFYKNEMATRGYCPGNWKWLTPCTVSSLYEGYLNLNTMTEYTLKPSILPGLKGHWRNFDDKLGITAVAETKEERKARMLRKLRQACTMSTMLALHREVERQPKIVIMFASVSGTAANGAKQLRSILSKSVRVSMIRMCNFDAGVHLQLLRSCTAAIFITSTYGSGAPPPEAVKFVQFLTEKRATGEQLSLKFAVLGYGSTAYPRFCAAADLIASLLGHQGDQLLPTGKVDELDRSSTKANAWMSDLMKVLARIPVLSGRFLARLSSIETSLSDDHSITTFQYSAVQMLTSNLSSLNTRWPKSILGKVVEVRDFSEPPDYGLKVITIDYSSSSSAPYYPGGNVAVYPRRSEQVVRRAAAAFGLTARLNEVFIFDLLPTEEGTDADEILPPPFPTPTTVRDVLTSYLDLESAPTIQQICGLAASVPDDTAVVGDVKTDLVSSLTSKSVAALDWIRSMMKSSDQEPTFTSLDNLAPVSLESIKEGREYEDVERWLRTESVNWITLFEAYPRLALAPLAVLMQTINPQHPRYYSVASSEKHKPQHLELVVSLLRYTTRGTAREQRLGVCSSFLSRVAVGDHLDLHHTHVPSFRLPLSDSIPVITVSAGSGFAPFRGFLQERLFRHGESQRSGRVSKTGPFLALHGCRNEDGPAFFKQELDASLACGTLTKFLVAYSRSQSTPKQYVQSLIAPSCLEYDLLLTVLKSPDTVIYVCGDVGMATAIRQAFESLVDAKDAVAAIMLSGRYREEYFGSHEPPHK